MVRQYLFTNSARGPANRSVKSTGASVFGTTTRVAGTSSNSAISLLLLATSQ